MLSSNDTKHVFKVEPNSLKKSYSLFSAQSLLLSAVTKGIFQLIHWKYLNYHSLSRFIIFLGPKYLNKKLRRNHV